MDAFKFYIKLVVVKVRALLFFFAPVRVNKIDWENRILLINLDLIGDIVMFTAILKQYRNALPGKNIFVLLNGSSGVSSVLIRDHVDEVIMIDMNAIKINPRYGYDVVKKLRQIGFVKVIEHNPGVEFVGKIIATELGAAEVIGYHGFAIDDALPPDANFALGLRYFRKTLMYRFTTIIPAIAEPSESEKPRRLRHMILHWAAIFEGATGRQVLDYTPQLPATLPSDASVREILKNNNIAPLSYCLVSLGTSTPRKEWPIERFIELGKILVVNNIHIILTGGVKDALKSQRFVSTIGAAHCLDLTGKTSILEAASLVRYSLFAMSNDTSIAHFAIAFKRPSFTILWLAQPGRTSIYGYRDINKWIFKEDFYCFGDNGRCARTVGPQDPAPCVAAITVEDARQALIPLLDHLLSGEKYPREDFSLTV